MGDESFLNEENISSYQKFLSAFSPLMITDQNHCSEILKFKKQIVHFCFSPSIEPIATKSFMVLNLCPPSIFEDFHSDDSIFISITKILDDKNSPDFLISRVASILLQIILNCNSVISSFYIGFIVSILYFAENECVAELLTRITSTKIPIPEFHEVLARIEFMKFVAKLLNEGNPEKIPSLCAIIRNCSRNKSLSDFSGKEEIILAMEKLVETDDVFQLGAIWEAIAALCSQDTFDKMNKLKEKALSIALEPISTVRAYFVYIWDFLGKLVQFTDKNDNSLITSQQNQVILNLIIQFPDNSNLQGSLFRYMKNAILTKEDISTVIYDLIPFMETVIEQEGISCSAANCKLLYEDLYFSRLGNSNLMKQLKKSFKSFEEIYIKFVEPYFFKIKSEYGGDSKKCKSIPIILMKDLLNLKD